MRAWILQEQGHPLSLRDDVDLAGPEAGEVRIRLAVSGICHSDLSFSTGVVPAMLPAVPGHEGAGIVTGVGKGVSHVKEGDRVLIALSPPCGKCRVCMAGKTHLCMTTSMAAMMIPRFRLAGEQVFGMVGVGTFAEETIVSAESAFPLPDDVPFTIGALLGCGALTGIGAAINAARVVPGSSVVVLGCGGVGMNVVQGARLCGAAEIVAVDLHLHKAEQARQFGATHAITPDQLAGTLEAITAGEGFDYAFEVVGRSQTMRSAWDSVARGGTVVVVGVGRLEDNLQLNALEIAGSEKTLRGSIMGSSDVRRDVDRLIRLWREDRLPLERLVTHKIGIDGVPGALDALTTDPNVIRTVVEFN